MSQFQRRFIAQPQHIDELGHVNNTVWLQWVQEVATSHWFATADRRDVEKYYWVVTRHEIDYRGNIKPGEGANATTWIPAPPKGAQFDRRVDFTNDAGKVIVSALSRWAMLDQASGRLVRVPVEIAALFLP